MPQQVMLALNLFDARDRLSIGFGARSSRPATVNDPTNTTFRMSSANRRSVSVDDDGSATDPIPSRPASQPPAKSASAIAAITTKRRARRTIAISLSVQTVQTAFESSPELFREHPGAWLVPIRLMTGICAPLCMCVAAERKDAAQGAGLNRPCVSGVGRVCGLSGVRGDRDVGDASPIVREKHQHEQQAAGHVGTTKKSAATI
jgi:hypothetical protein